VNHKVWELFYLLIIIDKENYNELCDYVPGPTKYCLMNYDMLISYPTCQKKLVNKVLVNKKKINYHQKKGHNTWHFKLSIENSKSTSIFDKIQFNYTCKSEQ
jgi:hypothetical protein